MVLDPCYVVDNSEAICGYGSLWLRFETRFTSQSLCVHIMQRLSVCQHFVVIEADVLQCVYRFLRKLSGKINFTDMNLSSY